jgi:uncharacterized membrane protein YfcA
LALVISPIQAAAILLPILCVMDLFTLWAYRQVWHGPSLLVLLPSAMVGIFIGGMTFHLVDDDMLRLLVGTVALLFGGYGLHGYWFAGAVDRPPVIPSKPIGGALGVAAGFTSFVAHAGGPLFNLYILPQKLDKTLVVGTSALFFLTVNYTKLVPYAWLGQLNVDNLLLSALLVPLAPFGVFLGVVFHKKISQKVFYLLSYFGLIIAGAKLIADSVI